MTEHSRSCPETAEAWPPMKKALWNVLMRENLNDGHYIKAFDLIEKLYEAVAQARQVPDGYVIMPREATRVMTMAGCDSLPSCEHVFGHAGEMLANAYRKMVEVCGHISVSSTEGK